MTRHATIESAPAGRIHDHVVWCGNGRADFDIVALAAARAAVANGERLICISEDGSLGALAEDELCSGLVENGVLRATTVAAAYCPGGRLDPLAACESFDAAITDALRDGFRGARVVADNSSLVSGPTADLARWLTWEQLASALHRRPLSGACFFDRELVDRDVLTDLAAVHPLHARGFPSAGFQLFSDGEVIRVLGALDAASVTRLRRVLVRVPDTRRLILDISEAEFVDHRALAAINAVAHERGTICLRGATAVVRRVWELLAVPAPALEIEAPR